MQQSVFDLLLKQNLSKSEREHIKQVSQTLLTAIVGILPTMTDWTKTEVTQAAVRVLIRDTLWQTVPQPPYSEDELESLTGEIYGYVWERSVSGGFAA